VIEVSILTFLGLENPKMTLFLVWYNCFISYSPFLCFERG